MADPRRTRRRDRAALSLALLLTAACTATPAHRGSTQAAEDGSRFTIGYRLGTALGDGEPANDLPMPASLWGRV